MQHARKALAAVIWSLTGLLPATAAGSDPPKPGDLDVGFGRAGIVVVEPPDGAAEGGAALVADPAGGLFVAGTAQPGPGAPRDLLLLHFRPDGTLDRGFGRGGRIWTDLARARLPDVGRPSAINGSDDVGRALAADGQGRLLMAGSTSGASSTALMLVRYRPDGDLDRGFGHGGQVVLDLDPTGDDDAYSVAVDPRGRIMLAGESGEHFAVTRLLSDGRPDPAFGRGGHVVLAGRRARAHAIAVQPDGRIVVAGQVRTSAASDLLVVRLLPDGQIDRGFAAGGSLLVDTGGDRELLRSLALGPAGTVLAAGRSASGFVVLRLQPDGRLDPTFGDRGVSLSGPDLGSGFTMVPAGPHRLVVAGESQDVGLFQVTVARYQSDGSLDPRFASGGIAVTDADPGRQSEANAMAQLPSGRLVIAGTSAEEEGLRPRVILAAYSP